ncbi:hypothetical protein BC629DRAFT_1589242 [Irpex lacteus]|nr:hypothetical protein BC629DRAFT_1589242 [Irpex lacteus]
MLSGHELQQAVSLMASLCKLYPAKDISARQCGLRWYSQPLENLTEIGLTFKLIPKNGGVVRSDCRFILGDPLPTTATSDMRSLVAFRAVFTKDDIHIDIGTLLNLLSTHATLRIVHFDFFDDYEHLRCSMHGHTQLMHPQLGELTFILTCQRSKYHPFSEVPIDSDGEYNSIGIDPLTLSPTGQSWRDWSYVVPSLLQTSNIG